MNWRTLATLAALGAVSAQVGAAATRPSIIQRPAARSNYTNTNRSLIRSIVVHKAEGANASGWFRNPAARASAHYDVHRNGAIFQSVQDDDMAWHAGNVLVNRSSIGIEHAGFSARADTTAAQYRASARLVAYLCVRYRIPIDRRHIIAHAEVPHPYLKGVKGGKNRHWDPGPHWNWTHYLNLIRSYAQTSPPPPPPPPSGRPVLRYGARGEPVKVLQRKLTWHGFSPGPIDGHLGQRTLSAVRNFQAFNGLVVDGVVGPQTWRALDRGAQTRATLRVGARGADVTHLQRTLRSRGFDPGPADGHFGQRTLSAVRRFQAARGLAVDGVVGPFTWRELARR